MTARTGLEPLGGAAPGHLLDAAFPACRSACGGGAPFPAAAALCAAEDEERETPLVATAPYGYLRLRRPDDDPAALDAWAERVLALPWKEAFVFFKHEPLPPVTARASVAPCSRTSGRSSRGSTGASRGPPRSSRSTSWPSPSSSSSTSSS